jgi:hypothetical protein
MRELGSLAVSLDVSFAFIPFMRAQKLSRRAAAFGLDAASFEETGRLML